MVTIHYSVTISSLDFSSGTGKLCIFGNLGIVFIWSFLFCLLSFISFVLRKLMQSVLRYLKRDPYFVLLSIVTDFFFIVKEHWPHQL